MRSFPRIRVISATVLLLLALGCQRKDVILIADGRVFTAEGRDCEISLRMRLFGMSHPSAGAEELSARRKMLLDSSEEYFLSETASLQAARELGVSASEEEVAAHMRSFARFADKLSEMDRVLMKDIARREVLCAKAAKTIGDSLSAEVTEGELNEASRRLSKYAEAVAEASAAAWVKATNAWQAVCSGMDFAVAAKTYSEGSDGDSCEWGTFPAAALSDSPALLSLLPNLKEGDVTPPVEGDNGIVVVRLKGVDKSGDGPVYSMDRMFFMLPEDAPTMSRGELAQHLAADKRSKALAEAMRERRAAMKVVRP